MFWMDLDENSLTSYAECEKKPKLDFLATSTRVYRLELAICFQFQEFAHTTNLLTLTICDAIPLTYIRCCTVYTHNSTVNRLTESI